MTAQVLANPIVETENNETAKTLNILKMIHDIKAPLMALRVVSNHLSKQSQGDTSPSMDLLTASLGRLEGMLSRCVGEDNICGPLTLQSLQSMCQQLIDEQNAIFNQAMTLSWNIGELDMAIDGQSIDLQRLLGNLLMNTSQGSGKAKAVDLSVSLCGSAIRLALTEDHPPEVRRSPFSLGGLRRGWGFGVMIVREIAHRNGWRLHWNISRGSGARVDLWLPVT